MYGARQPLPYGPHWSEGDTECIYLLLTHTTQLLLWHFVIQPQKLGLVSGHTDEWTEGQTDIKAVFVIYISYPDISENWHCDVYLKSH